MESIDNLSKKLLNEYGNRKREGRLDLVYDIESERFYPVPKEIEHREFMPQIKEHNWRSLIPVQYRIEQKENKKVITYLTVGASSFEKDLKVRHPEAYLKKAYEESIILACEGSDFEIARDARLEIQHMFAERN
ncbi:hypothetical protein GF361_03465 [Candidatus Woesearchaeota archaeon]|nr:hypothetical protein [Candidatus Woesearchaeota archaeon]